MYIRLKIKPKIYQQIPIYFESKFQIHIFFTVHYIFNIFGNRQRSLHIFTLLSLFVSLKHCGYPCSVMFTISIYVYNYTIKG